MTWVAVSDLKLELYDPRYIHRSPVKLLSITNKLNNALTLEGLPSVPCSCVSVIFDI
jgi:hypothetical protein